MKRSLSAISLATATLLAACGGGNSSGTGDTAPVTKAPVVRVVGDSLNDVGVYGFKFTVQSASNAVFAERIAASFGAPALCAFFRYDGVSITTKPECTNYAVGGGVVNNPADPTSPLSIVKQLAVLGATTPSFGADDLLIADGGSNDIADVTGAFLKAKTDGGVTLVTLASSLLPMATIQAIQAAAPSPTAALVGIGQAYLKALAGSFYTAVKTNAFDKGAKKVFVVNAASIQNTPRFQMVLAAVEAASDKPTRVATEAIVKGFVDTFNTELAAKFAGDSRALVFDFAKNIDDEVATPEQYALSNTKNAVCPPTGISASGLPTYTFATCTEASLDASPPSGASGAGWWKHYGFSDSFHPTPFGHQLLHMAMMKQMVEAGWYK